MQTCFMHIFFVCDLSSQNSSLTVARLQLLILSSITEISLSHLLPFHYRTVVSQYFYALFYNEFFLQNAIYKN